MKQIETPESLWGDDKTDPADALQSNNFQMRKCFLSKTLGKPRGRRNNRGRGRPRKAAEKNGKEENGKETAEASS